MQNKPNSRSKVVLYVIYDYISFQYALFNKKNINQTLLKPNVTSLFLNSKLHTLRLNNNILLIN